MELERSKEMITLNKEDAFTIVDIISKAQEIVRCRDCIWWCECKTKDKFPYKKDSCNKFGTKMNADDFCSWGVKKDEN